jgi:hypothetical protein
MEDGSKPESFVFQAKRPDILFVPQIVVAAAFPERGYARVREERLPLRDFHFQFIVGRCGQSLEVDTINSDFARAEVEILAGSECEASCRISRPKIFLAEIQNLFRRTPRICHVLKDFVVLTRNLTHIQVLTRLRIQRIQRALMQFVDCLLARLYDIA